MIFSDPLFVLLAMIPVIASVLLGCQLKIEYLRELVRQPRALMVGFGGQYLLLPLIALVFFYAYPAPEHVRWGWFILAAVPGGALSNMVTFLGRGRLSLSVVLTAGSTLTGIVTIPFWVGVGSHLLDGEAARELPIARMVIGNFLVLVVPLMIGIAIAVWRPLLAQRLRRPTRMVMLMMLVLGVGMYTVRRWSHIAADFDLVTLIGAALFHIVIVLGVWGIGRTVGLDRRDSFTVGIEGGVQNVVMALLVVELLGRRDLVAFVSYFTLASWVLVILWVALLGQRSSAGQVGSELGRGAA